MLSVPSRTSLRWLERHRIVFALTAALAAVFAYRMIALRSYVGLGVDAGNYLATARQLFGTDITGWGLTRPPLVGVALWPLMHLFGPLEATKILAVAVSALIGIPFYLLCSRYTGRDIALGVSLLFIFSSRYMETVNWGFLTLAGVGLFTLCFYLIHEVVTAPKLQRRMVVALGLASLALLGTNRTSAFIFVFVALAFCAVALIAGGQLRKGVLRLLPSAMLALLLVLPFIGLYLDQIVVIGNERYLSFVGSWDGVRGAWDGVTSFYFDNPPLLWAVVAITGLAGAAVLVRRSPAASALPLTLLLALLALSVLFTGDTAGRARYFLYVPIWLGVAVFADALARIIPERKALAAVAPVWGLALLTLLGALTLVRGHFSLQNAAEFYGYLNSEHVQAIDTADRLALPGVGVVHPWPLAQWAEGLAGRRIYAASQRSALSPQGQGDQPFIADALLSGDRVTTNGAAFVADAYSLGDVPMDPLLGVDNGALKHLLYLDDRLIEIEYGEGAAARRVTLAEAQLQQRATTTEGGAWLDTRSYHFDGLSVIKNVTLPERGEGATVTLRLDSESGPVTRVLVPLQPGLPSSPVSMTDQQAMFAFTGWSPFTFQWWTGAYIDLTSSATDAPTLTLTPSDAATLTQPAGETIAVAEVRPGSPQADLTLAFTFKGSPAGEQRELRTYTSQNAMKYHDISFVVVDRQPVKPWFGDPVSAATLAWLESSPYFQPLWDGGNVAAYSVIPPQQRAGGEQARSEAHGSE